MSKKDEKALAPGEIEAAVAEYERGFQLLAAAQERKACVFETGTGHVAQLPHLQAARKAASIIALRIVGDLKHGDIDRAIAGTEVLLRLSRNVRSRSGAVGR